MAFQKLDTRTITLRPPEAPSPVGWVKLDTRTITLSPPAEVSPIGWVKLDTRSITVTPKEEAPPPPPTGWVKLDTRTITLTPTEAPLIPPEYKLIQHTEYPRGKTYVGKAERCTFWFKLGPEQIPGTAWLGTKIANIFAEQVAKQKAEILDLKVYEDTTPLLWTNFLVVATATASPLLWAIIIIAVLAILFIVAITFLIKEVKTIDWGKAAAFPVIAVVLGIAALAGIAFVLTRKKPEEKGR